MRTVLASLSLFASILLHRANTFPAYLNEIVSRSIESRGIESSLNRRVVFDPTTQYVSTTGAHAFVAPGPTDQRGPCPGLNAMANHGYLPHNGVATIDQFINATFTVFGMGQDMSTFLAVYGAVMDGNLISWSIGGPVASLGGVGNVQPLGMSGSHNNYEGDVSPMRGDLYQYGNDYKLQVSQFQALYTLGQLNNNSYDIPLLTKYRATRFYQSVHQNPYFFNAPFAGVVASPAAWSFIYRFMGNKSAEHPEGYLNGDVLKSFYSITGSSGSFKYTPGYERIPDNWYKRALTDPYDIPFLALDIVSQALQYPEFASIGGNTGRVNTFTGIDPSNLTGGVYDAATLLQGNNLMCYGLRASLQQGPVILSALYADITTALAKLTSAFTPLFTTLVCPELVLENEAQFDLRFAKFPGYTKLKKATGSY